MFLRERRSFAATTFLTHEKMKTPKGNASRFPSALF